MGAHWSSLGGFRLVWLRVAALLALLAPGLGDTGFAAPPAGGGPGSTRTSSPDAAGLEDLDSALRPEASERPVAGTGPALSLDGFIREVLRSNLDLAAQRFNVPIARAQLAAARVSPNPVLNFGTGRDVTHEVQPTTYFAGLSAAIELPGKRATRTSAAAQNLLAAAATLEDYLRTLRGTAAGAYVDAVSNGLIVAEKLRACHSLSRLAEANDVRWRAGDLSQADDDQARADALQARGDLFSSQSTGRASQYALLQLLGRAGAALPVVGNHLDAPTRRFDLDTLLVSALRRRPDVQAARDACESARASSRLARLNRLPDPTLGLTVQQAQTGHNPIDPAPNFNSINLSVSVPLPVFNSLRGEYQAALNTAAQAQQNLRSAELKAEVDVRGAYARYQSALLRLDQYQNGALELASRVLQARLSSYQAGGATLLDVLQARKADTDVHLAYIDALGERARSVIALEQAAGLWDLDL